MAKFIVFTQKYKTKEGLDPFSLINAENYGKEGGNIAVISNINSCGLIEAPEAFLDNLNHYDILLLADITWRNEDLLKLVISRFAGNHPETYVVVHLNPSAPHIKEQHKSVISSLFGQQFDKILEESHIPGSIYFENIPEILSCLNNPIAYSQALSKLKARFPDDQLNQKIQKLHTSLSPIRGELSENIIIVWDELKKSRSFLPDQVLSPSQYREILNKTRESQGMVILCELEFYQTGEKINADQFYGIKLAQKLRQEGVNIPILFTSVLSRNEVFADNGRRAIINAIGHDFISLPCSIDDWKNILEQKTPLNELELYDIVQSYCNDAGIINVLLHGLYGGPISHLKTRISEILARAMSMFNQDSLPVIAKFEEKFPKIDEKNRKQAIEFAEEISRQLQDHFSISDTSPAKHLAAINWKLLFLDDEIGYGHPLLEKLNQRNVEVLCASSAEEAWGILENDFKEENRISIIVSDYRLEEIREGVQVHQPIQGYRFIKEVSTTENYIRLAALSALPRRFLMHSFQHFGVRVEIFSKKDYLKNEATMDILADELVDLGNESAEAISRLPQTTSTSTQWGLFEPFYRFHRNSTYYKQNESEISIRAKQYCLGIKNGIYSFQLEGFSKALKGKRKNPTNKKAFDEFKNKMIARRVAIWYSQFAPYASLLDVLKILKGPSWEGSESETTAKNFINTNLALSLSDFPWNMTIEEKHWMTYEMGFGNIQELEVKEELIRSFSAGKIKEWVDKHPEFHNILNDEHLFTIRGIRKAIEKIYREIHKHPAVFESFVKLVQQCKTHIRNVVSNNLEESFHAKNYWIFLEKYISPALTRLRIPLLHETITDPQWDTLRTWTISKAEKRQKGIQRNALESIAYIFFHELRKEHIAYPDKETYVKELLKRYSDDEVLKFSQLDESRLPGEENSDEGIEEDNYFS